MTREEKKIQVDREQVRIMVSDFGYQETAKRTGISANTLYQWANRFNWKAPIPHVQKTVRTVRSLSDVHAEAMRDLKLKTKLSLAKYSAKASRDAEKATLRDSPLVHKVAQVASLVWPEEQKASNILQLGVLIGSPGSAEPVIDVSESQDSGD